MNALRHGLLSKDVVIKTGEGRENQSEYNQLLSEFCKNLDPVGALEEWQVQEIVNCVWRLRRAQRCEVGLIRQRVDNCSFDFVEGTRSKRREDGPIQSDPGAIRGYIEDFMRLGAALENEDPLSSNTRELIAGRLSRYEEFIPNVVLYKQKQWSWHHPPVVEGISRVEESDLKSTREKALKEIADQIAELEIGRWLSVGRESLRCSAQRSALSLPSSEDADRLLRYETAIKRQLYRAMDQLERLQRQRKGDFVPPAKAHLSLDK